MNEWFALSIIDQVHNLQPRFMGCETHPPPLVSKFFCGKIVLCAKKAYLCLWLIPWKSITKSQNTFFLHVQNHVLWFFKTPGLDPARWSKDEGSCCEGLIPEVAKSSKALPKWAGFCLRWFERMNDGLSLPSSWLPTPPTIEGSHSNHKNIKVLVDEAFESWSYSPQSIFDTLRSQYCQLLCYVGTFRSHPLLQQQRVCHTAALPFRLNSILRQKTALWKLNQIFHHAKI